MIVAPGSSSSFSHDPGRDSAAATGEANIEFLQITPTTVQVQFPGITGGNLMYVEARLYRPPPRESPWQNAIILEGNKIFTLTGLRAGTRYRLRWQAPDRQYPDVEVSTQGERETLTNQTHFTSIVRNSISQITLALNKKPPKAIVTGKTFDSVTLSFDHFAPDDYQHGYVAMVTEFFMSAKPGN